MRQPGPEPERSLPSELEEIWANPLVRHALGAAWGVRRAFRRHRTPLDAALAALVLAAGVTGLVWPQHTGRDQGVTGALEALLAASVLGQAVPLVWRRRAPLAVFGFVLISCTVQWWVGDVQRSVIALLIAIYSATRYGRAARLPWSIPFLVVGLVISALRVEPYKQLPWYSLFFLCSAALAAAALGLVARARAAQFDALKDRAARLEVEREQRYQLAALAERSRVSREMHDILGHNLAVIIGLADGAGAAAARDPSAASEALSVIASTGREALRELRRTLGSLDGAPAVPELAPQPGIAELAGLLERIHAAGPRISHRTVGETTALSPSTGLTLYRIVQEALTNSLKHAGPATSIHVELRVGEDSVDISVRDTGRPGAAHAPADPDGGGRGLVGIRERAVLAGGTARAGPAADGGWLVRAELPYSPHPPPQEGQM